MIELHLPIAGLHNVTHRNLVLHKTFEQKYTEKTQNEHN